MGLPTGSGWLIAAFGPWQWLIVLVIVLLLFGNRLPSMMRSLGRGVTEFKKGLEGGEEEEEEEEEERPKKKKRKAVEAADDGQQQSEASKPDRQTAEN